MDRLLLVRHATTAETRRAAFPATSGAVTVDGCAPLDRAGRAAAAALGAVLPPADRVWASAARRCADTAASAGLSVDAVDADLAECDFGRWAGRTPDEVHAEEPEALAAWYADPDAAPHGGEGLAAVRSRAAAVLGRAAGLPGTTVAVTSGGLVKAALLEVLGLPSSAVWRLDAPPASVTELHPAGDGGWRVVRLGWTPALVGGGAASAAASRLGPEPPRTTASAAAAPRPRAEPPGAPVSGAGEPRLGPESSRMTASEAAEPRLGPDSSRTTASDGGRG